MFSSSHNREDEISDDDLLNNVNFDAEVENASDNDSDVSGVFLLDPSPVSERQLEFKEY